MMKALAYPPPMAIRFRRGSSGRRSSGPCSYLLLIPIGIILGIWGIVMLMSNIALVANGVKTTGIVVDVKERVDHEEAYTDEDGRYHEATDEYSYFPIIEFKTEDGLTVQHTSNFGSGNRPTVGTSRAMIYEKGNPDHAQEDSAGALWILPIVLILIGLLALGAGVVLFILAKKAAKALLGVAQGAQQGGMAGASGVIANLMGMPGTSAAAEPMPAIPPIAPPSPVNPQLADYVRQSRAAGVDDATIRQSLLSQGWNAPDIDAGFR